ncbi:GNAT family N-acetyltransferase [Herbidospora mongoliensis]|uniref:GNAT family N-acetyltransferase n=1 Tax=Herbidospora mongoliensis TaxID=688067 RepID=UPI000833C099|nr:GNAT family protein [Herbidospora mongoliensis]
MDLEIRPIGLTMATDLAAVYQENRDFLQPYEPVRADAFFTAGGQRDNIRTMVTAMRAGDRWPAMIYLGDRPCGFITLNTILRGALQSARVGYWVAEKDGGRGVATRALGIVLDVAFCELGLHRIEASVRVDNPRSKRVLEKNGFSTIGIARRHVFLDGAWRDEYLMERHAPPIRNYGQ